MRPQGQFATDQACRHGGYAPTGRGGEPTKTLRCGYAPSAPERPRLKPGTRNRPLTHGNRFDYRNTMMRQGAGAGGGRRGRFGGSLAHTRIASLPTKPHPCLWAHSPHAPLIACERIASMGAQPKGIPTVLTKAPRLPWLSASLCGSPAGGRLPRPQGEPLRHT
jgi:hypothetical protein